MYNMKLPHIYNKVKNPEEIRIFHLFFCFEKESISNQQKSTWILRELVLSLQPNNKIR